MLNNAFRKTQVIPRLIKEALTHFDNIRDIVASRGLSLYDCLMSGLPIFDLKFLSILQFEHSLE